MLNKIGQHLVEYSTNNDITSVSTEEEDCECNDSYHEDEFVNSNHADINSSPQNNSEISNLIVGFFSNFSERISQIFSAFTPLLSFLKDLSGTQSNEQLIQNFSNLLQSTNENVNGRNLMSRESREALNGLNTVVSHLQQSNSNINLSQIISQWRSTGDAQNLLHMAEQLERGGCTSLNESEARELRESFIRGLRTLARAIRNAEELGESYALEHLQNAANPLVDGVERAHEVSQQGDGRLTHEDRRFMGERLQECCEHVDEGRRNGIFNGLDNSVVDELNRWTDFVYDFLKDFFERLEEEREEDEKAQKEKQCQERCEEQEQIRVLHSLHKRAEKEKFKFRSLMNEAMREAFIALRAARAELNNVFINRAKHNREIEIARKEQNNFLYAENLYKRQSGLESYYKSFEQQLTYDLPPASVCEHESPFGFNLDICC